jgi:hypothetical protein
MIEHCQILRLLFVRGFKTSLLVGGLGVEDDRMVFAKLRYYVMWFIICGVWPNRKSTDQSQERLMNWNNKIEILSSLFLWLLKEECWVCIIPLAEMCTKRWGLRWNLKMNGNVWALKWCEDYSNITFSGTPCAELYQSLSWKFMFWIASGEWEALLIDLFWCIFNKYPIVRFPKSPNTGTF